VVAEKKTRKFNKVTKKVGVVGRKTPELTTSKEQQQQKKKQKRDSCTCWEERTPLNHQQFKKKRC
jgi:hypothetical protein